MSLIPVFSLPPRTLTDSWAAPKSLPRVIPGFPLPAGTVYVLLLFTASLRLDDLGFGHHHLLGDEAPLHEAKGAVHARGKIEIMRRHDRGDARSPHELQ